MRAIAWIVLAAFGLQVTGCSAIRQRMASRCEKCNSLCEQARQAKEQGWPDQADLLLNEALRQRPNDLETRRQLGETLWLSGRRAEAISEFQDMVLAHPRDSRLHQRLAVMQWEEGQCDAALRSSSIALRFEPNSADALLVKARAEVAQRDFDAAVASYIRLTRIAPELVEVRLELADVHVRRGHPLQATTLLRDVLQQSDLSVAWRADVEWNLGIAYGSADRWEEAVTHLKNAASNRVLSGSDMQFLTMAQRMSGEDEVTLPLASQLAAVRAPDSVTGSAWENLRDELLQRQRHSMDVGALANDGIIRADFQRSATTDSHRARERLRR